MMTVRIKSPWVHPITREIVQPGTVLQVPDEFAPHLVFHGERIEDQPAPDDKPKKK